MNNFSTTNLVSSVSGPITGWERIIKKLILMRVITQLKMKCARIINLSIVHKMEVDLSSKKKFESHIMNTLKFEYINSLY